MRNTSGDPLYYLFEQHLFNALVEDEGTDAFLARVVDDYVMRLIATGTVIPREVLPTIENDLREEVLEMLRKKTYGHFSLADFRRAKNIEAVPTAPPANDPAQNEKARRNRRAC
ncbi:MAG: hypothetical protein V4760_16700 [Bdellovibrionota bacterium]